MATAEAVAPVVPGYRVRVRRVTMPDGQIATEVVPTLGTRLVRTTETVVETVKTKAVAAGRWLYWSGRGFGRGVGRAMRFFGRSSWRLVRGTGRFLGTTTKAVTGGIVRGTSWTVKTVLTDLFRVALGATLVASVITYAMARVADKYDTAVHQPVRRFTGKPAEQTTASGDVAADVAAVASDFMATAATSEDIAVPVTPVATEPKRAPFPEPDPDGWDYVMGMDCGAMWLTMDRDLHFPKDIVPTEEMVRAVLRRMTFVHDEADEKERRTREGTELSDADYVRHLSYWEGRMKAHVVLDDLFRTEAWEQPWSRLSGRLSVKAKSERANTLDRYKEKFESGALHQHSFRKAWDDQYAYLLDLLKTEWARGKWALTHGVDAESETTKVAVNA